jgi:REP element-mobilizing transposase RayT
MPTHKKRAINSEAYFVTFTCFKWLPLIEESKAYLAFDTWFNYLQTKHIKLLGYVIMPNHFHCLHFMGNECNISLNALVANAKRFLAYEIIKGLELYKNEARLFELFSSTTKSEKERGKRHKVFKTSFDSIIINSRADAIKVLKYIHNNPNAKKWNLCNLPENYQYSSCMFYFDRQKINANTNYVTDFREIF